VRSALRCGGSVSWISITQGWELRTVPPPTAAGRESQVRCPNHLLRKVSGYCSVCGTLFCEECLHPHEGNLYCPKHYKPIAEKVERERQLEERRKKGRMNLIVRFPDGREEKGVSLALNHRERDFHLERVDTAGVTTGAMAHVAFDKVEAVFHVKAFDGRFDPHEDFVEYDPTGEEMVVRFQNGDIVRGRALHHYNSREPRFYVIPDDPNSNNLSVLVQIAAVEGIYTPEQYDKMVQDEEQRRRSELAARKASNEPEDDAPTREESMGDFYFESQSYPAALEQYRVALKQKPDSLRIRKKIIASTFNVGLRHVKRRRYEAARECAQEVINLDPDNAYTKKKAQQLMDYIDKHRSRK